MCHDTLFESAVTVCIILNTVFLAIEHHGMSAELKHVLEIGELCQFLSNEQLQSLQKCPCSETHFWPHFAFFSGNKVFTTFFTAEAALKLLALSKEYFQSGWNIFDLIIVIASLVDLSVENINGISVLRGMRLVRFTTFLLDFEKKKLTRF